MNRKNLKYIFSLLMTVLTLSSCSETNEDEATAEFANWQEINEKAFSDTLSYARQQIDNGSKEWKVILNWSLQNQTPNKDANGNVAILKYNDDDHIVVHVLKEGTGTAIPAYTDSIKLSYRGRLLPSPSYSNGYVFDQTFEGNYDKATAMPTSTTVMGGSTGWIDGFTTALSSMHVGDHWMVFMPYNLAYGTSGYNGIPGYSLLRFEMVLDAYKPANGKWITE